MKPDRNSKITATKLVKNGIRKTNKVSYASLHNWVEEKLGKPQKCDNCNRIEKRRYEWANVSGEYKRDLEDWIRLCVPCHRKKDGQTDKFIQWRKHNNPPAYWLGKKHTEEWKKNDSEKMKIIAKTRQRNERGLFI